MSFKFQRPCLICTLSGYSTLETSNSQNHTCPPNSISPSKLACDSDLVLLSAKGKKDKINAAVPVCASVGNGAS